MERTNQLHHMWSMEFRPPKYKVVIGCVVVSAVELILPEGGCLLKNRDVIL